MSLLDEIYATPNRVAAVVKLLAKERGQRLKRELAEHLLSPVVLQLAVRERSQRADDGKPRWAMVRGVLKECTRLRLVLEDGEMLQLDPTVTERVLGREPIGEILPLLLLDRVLDADNREDEQMAEVLAWYLGQDVLAAPGTLAEFTVAATDQGLPDRLRLNDNRFGMFRYWARFFGLANVLGTEAKQSLTPEPTPYLRRLLPRVFVETTGVLPAREFLSRVAANCRLFEGGDVRGITDQFAPRRQPQHLSTTTSHALLRLKEEGVLRLTERSDADAVALVEEKTTHSVAEIAWVPAAEIA